MAEQNRLTALIAKAIRRDEDAFTELCNLKGQSVLYLCIKIMGNTQDGEDAAQEVFVNMYNQIGQLQHPEAFSVWLHRLILGTCNKVRRQTMKSHGDVSFDFFPESLAEENTDLIPQQFMERQETRQMMLSVLNGLPKNQRVSVLLYYYDGMSYAEIAEVMDTTPKAVENYLYRAKRTLQEEIEKQPVPKTDAEAAGPGKKSIPMMAITQLLMQDANVQAPASMVAQCIQGAGFGIAVAASGATASTPVIATLKVAISSLLGIGVIASAVAVVTTAAAPLPGGTVFGEAPAQSVAVVVPGTIKDDTLSVGDISIPLSAHSSRSNSAADGVVVVPTEGEEAAASSTAASSRSASRAVSSAAASSAAQAPAQPVPQLTPLYGSILFRDKNGHPVPTENHVAEGYIVSLYSGDVLLDQATADAEGSYAFETLLLTNAGSYTLRFEAPYNRAAAFAPQNTGGSLTVSLTPGANHTQLPNLYITDSEAPSVSIVLTPQVPGSGNENPAKAEIFIGDETATRCQWKITNSNGTTVASGNGTIVTSPFAGLGTGNYSITATVTDAAGNQTVQQEAFAVL